MNNEIKLKIVIDGQEANAAIQLTDENVRDLYKQFRFGQADVNGFTTNLTRSMTVARDVIGGFKETFSVLRGMLAEPIKMAMQEEVLRSNFQGTEQQLQLFRKAVAGTVTDGSLIKMSNQATDLGLSMEQQAMLFSLAEDAADKYGGGVEEGFQKIVAASEGSAKGLKSLGIQKEVYESKVAELAKAQGTTIEKLDAEAQKQIRLEAVIKASGVTMADVAAKEADNADKLEQLSVGYEKLQVTVGTTLASAVNPFIKSLGSMLTALNDTVPGVTGVVGAFGVMGAALVALKMTGLEPTKIAMALFKVELTAMQATMAGLGGIAVFAGLIYGLGKLAEAWNLAKQKQQEYLDVQKGWISSEKTEMEGMSKTQRDAFVKYGEDEAARLKAENITLKKQYNDAVIKRERMDKEGNAWVDKIETDKSKALNLDIEKNEKLIQKYEARKKSADEVAKTEAKIMTVGSSADGDTKGAKDEAENIRRELAAAREVGEGAEMVKLDQWYADRYKLVEKNLLKESELDELYAYKKGQIWEKFREQEAKAAVEREEQNARAAEVLQEQKKKHWEEAMTAQIGLQQFIEDSRINLLQDGYERELALERQKNAKKKSELDAQLADKLITQEQHAAALAAMQENYAAFEVDINKRKEDAKLQGISSTLGQAAGLFGRGTAAYKGLAAAQATIDTWRAATAALAPPPTGLGPIFGPIAAGVAIATGLANVAKIVNTKIPALAEGGIVTSPTIAMIGEAGREAVIPLDRGGFGDFSGFEKKLDKLGEAILNREWRVKGRDLVLAASNETAARERVSF